MKKIVLILLLLWTYNAYSQPLLNAIKKGNDDAVVRIIQKSPEKINSLQDKETGDYAIHLSILNNRSDYLSKLLEQNADVNLQNGRDNTPLIISVADNQYGIFKMLMQKNPDIEKSNFNGNTALLIAVKNNNDTIIQELVDANANINVKNIEEFNLIMFAVMNNNIKWAKYFLDKNISVEEQNIYDKSALDYVSSNEMRWLIGTEDYLFNYVTNMETLKKYQQKFPQSTNLETLALSILKKQSTVSAVFEVDDLKILNTQVIQKKATENVNNYNGASTFNKRYPNSDFNKQVVLNALQNSNSRQIVALRDMYDEDFELDSLDFTKLDANDYKKSKFMNAQFVLNPLLTLDDINQMFIKYSWLNFNDKNQIIMENYWNISSESLNFGIAVLDIMNSLPSKKEFDITTNDVNSFVQKKIYKEVSKNVYIKSTQNFGSNNPEWDNWCNNNEYTAGMVKDESELRYVVYGEIVNKSIFDLPVAISASGDIYKTTSVEGTGFWSNLLIGFFSLFSGTPTSSKQNVGSQSETFYIPSLTSNSTGMYSVLLDFDEGTVHEGYNFADFIKYKSSIEIENISSSKAYSSHILTANEIEQQTEWQEFAQTGLPDSKLYDMLRGTEVIDAEWKEKWQEILEERARIAAEIERMNAELDRSTHFSAGEDYCRLYKSESSSKCNFDIMPDGLFGGDYCHDNFSVTYTDAYGSDTYDYPADAYYLTAPVTVNISYIPSSGCNKEMYYISVTFFEGGTYSLNLD